MAAIQKHLRQLSAEAQNVQAPEKANGAKPRRDRRRVLLLVVVAFVTVGLGSVLAISIWGLRMRSLFDTADAAAARDEPAGHAHDHAAEDPHDHSGDDPHNHAADDPHDDSADDPHDHAADDPHDDSADDPHDYSAEDPHNHAADDPHDHSAENPSSDTSHAGHDEATSLALSPQGRRNVGLELVKVALRDFDRTVTVPATIVDRPGRSRITVSAPMTGIVKRIYPNQGEAVVPGQTLFDLRLTHEDVVEKQSDLLRDVEQLDVLKREVTRLEGVTRSGAVAGKTLLERLYEQQKLEAAIRAEKQALKLHGLSEDQINSIVENRQLLQDVAVVAPEILDSHSEERHEEFLQLQKLTVQHGDHVIAGAPLGQLTDHCVLHIEGRAFEHDADLLNNLANEGMTVRAVIEGNDSPLDLKLLYIESQVELESRALRFYVELPNELVRKEVMPDGRRFVGWKFRPGQRVEMRIPIERWSDCIVLPVEAVVREGAESYVIQQFGDHFDRLAVHVIHRDQKWAVIEPDGTLSPGDRVAGKGAFQIHLAMKNKSGAAIDPHAGHGH